MVLELALAATVLVFLIWNIRLSRRIRMLESSVENLRRKHTRAFTLIDDITDKLQIEKSRRKR